MQCLILAGGLGTRVRHLSGALPKALIDVHGRPFIDYQLTWLAGQGVERVVLALGHKAGAVRDTVGDGSRWGIKVTCSDEGPVPLGTAGAIRHAIDEGLMDARFFVLYGDSYLNVDLGAVWRAAARAGKPLLTVHANFGRWDASNVVMRGDQLTLFEKGRADAEAIGMNHIDYGLSVLTRACIVDAVPPGGVGDLADVYHRLSLAGKLAAFEVAERFHEVGSPEGLAAFAAHVAGREGTDGG